MNNKIQSTVSNTPAKILVVGSVNGQVAEFFGKVKRMDEKYGPFSVVLVTGNLFGEEADNEEEAELLLSNKIDVPVMTYAIVGDRKLPRRVYQRSIEKSGEICNSLVIMTGNGVLQTSEGVRIAYIGGKYQSAASDESSDVVAFDKTAISNTLTQVAAENERAAQNKQAQLPVIDILLTFDWPYGVAASTQAACNKISYICAAAMPRYHFAAGEGKFYERKPWKYGDRVATGCGPSAAPHFTRFIGLGSVYDSTKGKQRWFYAMNVTPLGIVNRSKAKPTDLPSNCTNNPLYSFGRFNMPLTNGRALTRALESIETMKDFSGSHDEDNSSQKSSVPPGDYVCHICMQPGHWIQHCPSKNDQDHQQKHQDKRQHLQEKESLEDIQLKCWFCLANPNFDQNLVVSIGEMSYVTLPKGSLLASGDESEFAGYKSPIPGGGHVLIIPISHTFSMRHNSESNEELNAEVERWIKEISRMFAKYECVPLIFETCRCLPHVHTSVQVVPIPSSKASSVRPLLEKICKEDGLTISSSYPSNPQDGYFSLIDPGAEANSDSSLSRLVIPIPRKAKAFDLQIGRKLASLVLEIPDRANWRDCMVAEDAEERERDKFIAAFTPFDFSR